MSGNHFEMDDDVSSLTFSDNDNETPTTKKPIKGLFITRLQMVVFLFLILLLVIAVAVLASQLGPGRHPSYGRKGSPPKEKESNETTKTTPSPGSTPRPTKGDEPFANIRLPKNVLPESYDIFLEVDMKKERMVLGNSSIRVNVKQATKFFVLHAHNYRKIEGKVYKGDKLISSQQFLVNKFQYVVLETNEAVQPGVYSLRFDFNYSLRTDLKGFYYSSYEDSTGNKRDVAATQFEPVAARFAFPCFDEPAMKATFKMTIRYLKGMMAVSNMPIVEKWSYGDRMTNVFQISPVMPTYLVAFVVCDFGSKQTTANGTNQVNMTFYAPKEQVNQLDYAMEVGKRILPYFEEFFNVTYPLPKADMIAIPDFAAGAMENWGLITYRARALLFDENASSTSNKLYVSSVVSHELAHQWFGNIVTMDWWSDLWLNEGFASYVEYLGIDSVHPDWNVLDFQVISDVATGLALDSLVSSHPIYIEVEHPDKIDEIFDSISYQKGGSVLRMLGDFLGRDVFVKGLMKYLRKYSYANAKTNNLWESLSDASKDAGQNYNVTAIMNSWILQMNFPVIDVKGVGNGKFELQQTRFLRDPKPNLNKSQFTSPYNYQWYVPFRYMTIDANNMSDIRVVNNSMMKWMKFENVTIQTNSPNLILKGNAGQHGFFRVNYDADGWKNIESILFNNHKVLHVTDRAGIIGDVFALANSARVEYSTALDIFNYIHLDTDYLPWKAASDSISQIPSVLTRTRPAQKLFKKYMLEKVTPLFDKYGFKQVDNFLERYLQVLIVTLACGYGHQGCLGNATSMFKNWKEQNVSVPSDFRSVVYYYGVANSGIEDWDWMFERYRKNRIASEKLKLMYALSAIRESWALERYLNYGLNDSLVKSQDVSYVFSYVSNYGQNGRTIAWGFLKEHWDTIYQRYKSSFFTMRRIFGAVTGGFTTEYELNQMRSFIQTKKPENGQRILEQSEEKIKANIDWLKMNEGPIETWLRNNV